MSKETKYYKLILTVLLLLLATLIGLFIKTEYDKQAIVNKQIVKEIIDSLQKPGLLNNDSAENVIVKKDQEISFLKQEIRSYKNQKPKRSGGSNSNEVTSLKQRISKLNKQVDFLEKIKKNNDKKLQENSQQIADYKRQVNELNARYKTGNKNIDSLTIAKRENQAKLEALKQQKSEIESNKKTSNKTVQQQIEDRDKMIAELTTKNSQLQQQVDKLQQEQVVNAEKRKSLEQQVNTLTAQNTDLQKQNVDLQKQIAIYNPKAKVEEKPLMPTPKLGEKPFVKITKMNFSGIYQDEEGNDKETQMIGDANEFKISIVAQTNNNDLKPNIQKDFDIRVIDSITKKLVLFSKDQEIFSHTLGENNEVQCNLTGAGAFDAKTKMANVEVVFEKTKDWEKKIAKKNYYKIEVYCDSMMIGQQTFTLLEGKSKPNKLSAPATASTPSGKKRMPTSF